MYSDLHSQNLTLVGPRLGNEILSKGESMHFIPLKKSQGIS